MFLSLYIFLSKLLITLDSANFWWYKLIIIIGLFLIYSLFLLVWSVGTLLIVPEVLDYSYREIFEELRQLIKSKHGIMHDHSETD